MGASQKRSRTFKYVNDQPRPLAGHQKKLSVAGRSPKKFFAYRQQQVKKIMFVLRKIWSCPPNNNNGPFPKVKVVLKLILIVIKK